MNIKQIADKIVVESDVQASQYPVANRIDDINAKYLMAIEKAIQIGSKEPISGLEVFSEEFAVANGIQSQTFIRTKKDMPIVRVDFRPSGSDRFCRVDEDISRKIGGWCYCDMRFFADEKRIFVEQGMGGTIRITYARGNITLFTAADYALPTPPSPVWLPETFHPLLWLEPALTQAEFYKTDRVASLKRKLTELETLFFNHYYRNVEIDTRFDARDHRGWGGNNNR